MCEAAQFLKFFVRSTLYTCIDLAAVSLKILELKMRPSTVLCYIEDVRSVQRSTPGLRLTREGPLKGVRNPTVHPNYAEATI